MPASKFGLLGKSDLPATTDTTIYTVPANRRAVVNVRFARRDTGAGYTLVRLYLDPSGEAVGVQHALEYDAALGASGSITNNNVIEDTGISMGPGDAIVARASTTNVTVTCYGVEEDNV